MEIDHIFIRARADAPEALALARLGLSEGSANRHPGQGTANRRFFFHNAFIELLWLADAAEARSAPTAPTGLWQRLGGAGPDGGGLDSACSPFGVCFRPAPGADPQPPFASWPYRPAYLPSGLAVDIAAAPLAEPMWFFLGFGGRPDAAPPERRQPLAHPNGWREITALRITLAPGAADGDRVRSDTAAAARAAGVELVEGDAHLLEIGFDHEVAGRLHDLRPALPLILRW